MYLVHYTTFGWLSLHLISAKSCIRLRNPRTIASKMMEQIPFFSVVRDIIFTAETLIDSLNGDSVDRRSIRCQTRRKDKACFVTGQDRPSDCNKRSKMNQKLKGSVQHTHGDRMLLRSFVGNRSSRAFICLMSCKERMTPKIDHLGMPTGKSFTNVVRKGTTQFLYKCFLMESLVGAGAYHPFAPESGQYHAYRFITYRQT